VHTVDVVAVCLIVLIVASLVGVLARQRYMLRVGGAVPLAVRRGESRWIYGVARYAGGELRWYRTIGIGTRPTRVLARAQLKVIGHRTPERDELESLPAKAVIVECSDGGTRTMLAFGESAYTGFVSWLEASAPAG
jgi:hypothetical protein